MKCERGCLLWWARQQHAHTFFSPVAMMMIMWTEMFAYCHIKFFFASSTSSSYNNSRIFITIVYKWRHRVYTHAEKQHPFLSIFFNTRHTHTINNIYTQTCFVYTFHPFRSNECLFMNMYVYGFSACGRVDIAHYITIKINIIYDVNNFISAIREKNCAHKTGLRLLLLARIRTMKTLRTFFAVH